MIIHTGSTSGGAGRIAAAVASVVFGVYALMALAAELRGGFDVIASALFLFSAFAAALCGWFALRSHLPESRRHVMLTIRGGMIVGGVAFAAGFLGPAILKPDANQGPLLGIFVTGPIGFVVGAVVGWIYGRSRRGDQKL